MWHMARTNYRASAAIQKKFAEKKRREAKKKRTAAKKKKMAADKKEQTAVIAQLRKELAKCKAVTRRLEKLLQRSSGI